MTVMLMILIGQSMFCNVYLYFYFTVFIYFFNFYFPFPLYFSYYVLCVRFLFKNKIKK